VTDGMKAEDIESEMDKVIRHIRALGPCLKEA
jgi:hypothetical protein